MAKKNGKGGGNTNKSPHVLSNNQRNKLANVEQVSSAINLELSEIFKVKNDESVMDFSDGLADELDWESGKGILQRMVASPHQTSEVNFSFIKAETIYLDELKAFWEKLSVGASGQISNTLIPLFEKVMVEYIEKEILRLTPKELKNQLKDYLQGARGLNGVLSDLQSFQSQVNDPKQRNAYTKLIAEFRVPFSVVKRGLLKAWVDLSAMDNDARIDAWTPDQKELFDGMMSQMVIRRSRDRIKAMTDMMRGVDNLFSWLMPPISTFFKKYPFRFEELRAKYPTEWQNIDALYAQITPETSEEDIARIVSEADEMEFQLYLRDVSLQAPQMAQILALLKNESFDFSKLSKDQLTIFFQDLLPFRLDNPENQDIWRMFDESSTWDVKQFIKELFDFDNNQLKIGNLILQVEKKATADSDAGIASIEKMSAMTRLPLTFTVRGIDTLDLSLENRQMLESLFATEFSDDKKSIELKGNDIGKLMYLFLMVKKWSLLDTYNPRGAESILKEKLKSENDLGIVKRLKENLDLPNNEREHNNEENQDTPNQEQNQTPKEQFLSTWKKLKGAESSEEWWGFGPWAQIYVQLDDMDSLLPPFESGSKEWMRIEVTGVDRDMGKAKIKTYGTELPLADREEGVEIECDLKTLSEKILSEKSAFKLLASTRNDEQVMTALNNVGYDKDKFGGAYLRDGKFHYTEIDERGDEQEQEAEYFGISEEMPDPKGSGFKKQHILYKVNYNTDGTVDVEWDIPDMEWEWKSYKKKMKKSDFLLFVATKNLQPKTEKQALAEKNAMQDVISHQKRKRQRVSPAAMFSSIKNVWKNMQGKMDEYYKEQNDACMDWVVGSFDVYGKLGKMLPFFSSVSSATRKLKDEHLSKLESGAWKAIDWWLSVFGGMQDFSALFTDGADHPSGRRIDYVIGKGNTLKKILLSGESVVENSSLRPIMAAAMIANIKQGGGLYRGISDKENMGLRVKCLLGEAHHRRYMKMKEDVLARIKAGAGNADQLQDELKKSEITYIVNNVRNANAGIDFGSVDDQNKQILKQLYSDKFAGELENVANASIGMESVDAAYGKIKHINFNLAASDFKRFIKSSRFEKALANLKKMGDLAKTPRQQKELKMAMSYLMLSGIMNSYGDKKTRKSFAKMARTLMIPTALFATKWSNQHNAWHLLSKVEVEPSFVQALSTPYQKGSKLIKGLSESDFSITSSNLDYGNLLDRVWGWRGQNADAIDRYFQGLKFRDDLDEVEKTAVKEMWNPADDELDQNWRENCGVAGNAGLLVSLPTIKHYKDYDRMGFRGQDNEAKDNKATFWKNMLTSLKNSQSKNNPNLVNDQLSPKEMLRLFKTWFQDSGFSDSSAPELIYWLKTAQKVKAHIGKPLSVDLVNDQGIALGAVSVWSYGEDDYKGILEYLFKGVVLDAGGYPPPPEFEKIMDFFVNYFAEHIDELDDGVLSATFEGVDVNDMRCQPRVLIPWEEYNKYKTQNAFWEYVDRKNPIEKAKVQLYGKHGRFANNDLVELERRLRNKRIPMRVRFTDGDPQGMQDFVKKFYRDAARPAA